MKKLLIQACVLAAMAAGAADLVKNGKPTAVIYLESPPTTENIPLTERETRVMPHDEQQKRILGFAVRDLNYHLKKMSGTELPVITGKLEAVEGQTVIMIGKAAGIEPLKKSETREGYRLQVKGNRILIAGEGDAACAYGIYELLSRLGCDWVMPGTIGEVIPERKNISIDDLDISSAPDFLVRCPWYSPKVTGKIRVEFMQWKLRQRMQLDRDWHPLIMLGGHVSPAIQRQYKKEFEENPNLLALVRQPDGSFKRQGPQIETTDPKVVAIIEDYIRKMFETNGWAKDRPVCIGIGPADGGGFSESPESQLAGSGRIDPMSGSPDITDLYVLLANQILEKMEKEYPNLYLGFYLYNTHADFPMRYKPHPRLEIVIADITYSRIHSTLEPISKTRAYYKQILDQWAKLDNLKSFRGYNWNLAENFMPFSKLKMWGRRPALLP